PKASAENFPYGIFCRKPPSTLRLVLPGRQSFVLPPALFLLCWMGAVSSQPLLKSEHRVG
ncbi:hypothetical protein, partial [Serratia marcescens]|uniref:hypothetical protein n=1 Tax=Serratia marcescens TaxID=615 RepID=UPI0024C8A068